MRYYKCYSINLLRFIRVHGIKPISSGINSKTQRRFWIFVLDDELSRILTIWSNNKK